MESTELGLAWVERDGHKSQRFFLFHRVIDRGRFKGFVEIFPLGQTDLSPGMGLLCPKPGTEAIIRWPKEG